MTPADIIDFWFSAESRERWFGSTPEYDAGVRSRFESTWRRARQGDLAHWEASPQGALALVIILDQFPLNMFRDHPDSFSTEAMSREVAGRAVEAGLDRQLADEHKLFLYLPWMHSEKLEDQDYVVELFGRAGLDENREWAEHHRDIVERFGRFPHRNAILGRKSTQEEIDWLASPDGFNP